MIVVKWYLGDNYLMLVYWEVPDNCTHDDKHGRNGHCRYARSPGCAIRLRGCRWDRAGSVAWVGQEGIHYRHGDFGGHRLVHAYYNVVGRVRDNSIRNVNLKLRVWCAEDRYKGTWNTYEIASGRDGERESGTHSVPKHIVLIGAIGSAIGFIPRTRKPAQDGNEVVWVLEQTNIDVVRCELKYGKGNDMSDRSGLWLSTVIKT
ncbi:hypothetical protein BC937DRAFT_88393 [Endogone sp. FLAS-F59071]|nr:hypothetical protein BC937DRAFT_88393 [Endogone sp. FLAS-F59071]|eukprot:RUS18751.1 hypothetical protein BC937DRAFT_88393 [Endogone sp. FLAS-F59071]